MSDRRPVRRALVSVYDKTGLEDLVRGLADAGFMRPEVLEDVVVAADLDTALAGLASRLGASFGDKLRG